MIKIEFSYAQRFDSSGEERGTLTVYWPFVPREGEHVEFDSEDFDMRGIVHSVSWGTGEDENFPVAFVTLK